MFFRAEIEYDTGDDLEGYRANVGLGVSFLIVSLESLIVWVVAVAIVIAVVVPYVLRFRRRTERDRERKQEAARLGIDRPSAQFPYVDSLDCVGCGACSGRACSARQQGAACVHSCHPRLVEVGRCGRGGRPRRRRSPTRRGRRRRHRRSGRCHVINGR